MEPILRSLDLKRFRSIPTEHVTFANPTFLVGQNGSGKSNFVDVFSFLGAMAVKLLFEAGIAVYRNRIIVLCDNPFAPYIERTLRHLASELAVTERPGGPPAIWRRRCGRATAPIGGGPQQRAWTRGTSPVTASAEESRPSPDGYEFASLWAKRVTSVCSTSGGKWPLNDRKKIRPSSRPCCRKTSSA